MTMTFNSCIKTGAVIHLLAHDLIFHADLYEIEGAIVVRANGPLERDHNCWQKGHQDHPDYELHDTPFAGFWRDDLGLFVVPADQVRPPTHDREGEP
jgi:hypothetical protein